MGLTLSSTGKNAKDNNILLTKENKNDRIIALAGNPNVGKSSIFNRLTGLKQHTGNWPGKTVTNAQGIYIKNGRRYIMTDIPGTYSLMSHSKEEEVARDFICFGEPDCVVVVCDATCLERNLNLVLQTLEITENVVICVNLMDEAKKHKININLKKLSKKLGIPVVGTVARSGKGIYELIKNIEASVKEKKNVFKPRYTRDIEDAISILEPSLSKILKSVNLPARWVSIKLLENDKSLLNSINKFCKIDLMADENIKTALEKAKAHLLKKGISEEKFCDMTVSCIVLSCEDICNDIVRKSDNTYRDFDRRLDRFLTGKYTAGPVMFLLLLIIFWITIEGANIPSGLLSKLFFFIEDKLIEFAIWAKIPQTIYSPLIHGVYHVASWVVAVMLPPMAVFFPLFTLLEDLGYLPRIAFNLDCYFKKCNSCGKQALTMW